LRASDGKLKTLNGLSCGCGLHMRRAGCGVFEQMIWANGAGLTLVKAPTFLFTGIATVLEQRNTKLYVH
jgi:hypothetical protein